MAPRIVNSYVVSVWVLLSRKGQSLISRRTLVWASLSLSLSPIDEVLALTLSRLRFAFWVRLTWWVGYEFEWLLYEFADAVGERELLVFGF
ncbi:unnamed protein product [Prunus brigantina]